MAKKTKETEKPQPKKADKAAKPDVVKKDAEKVDDQPNQEPKIEGPVGPQEPAEPQDADDEFDSLKQENASLLQKNSDLAESVENIKKQHEGEVADLNAKIAKLEKARGPDRSHIEPEKEGFETAKKVIGVSMSIMEERYYKLFYDHGFKDGVAK